LKSEWKEKNSTSEQPEGFPAKEKRKLLFYQTQTIQSLKKTAQRKRGKWMQKRFFQEQYKGGCRTKICRIALQIQTEKQRYGFVQPLYSISRVSN
jgi:hypothetical protein